MISKDLVNVGRAACSKCVSSFINWGNPFEEVRENNFDPTVVSTSLDHHEEDLALTSPVITDKNGLRSFMSLKIFSKLDKLIIFSNI